MNFVFKKHTIQDANRLTELDLASDIVVKPEHMPILINDLTSFTGLMQSQTNLITTTILEIAGKNITIVKNHQENKVEFSSDGQSISENIYSYISNVLNIKFTEDDLKSRLVDVAANKITSLESFNNVLSAINNKITSNETLISNKNALETQLKSLKTQTTQNLKEEDIGQLEKKAEIDARLKNIQEQIDFYQNEKKIKDDLNSQIEKVQKDKERSNQMFESVKLLIDTRDGLNNELKKFGTLSADSQLEQKLDSMKETRLQKITNYLMNIRRNNNINAVDSINQDEDSYSLQGKILIILIILQVVLSIIFYFISFDTKIISLGFISMLFLIIILGLVNLFRTNIKKKLILNTAATKGIEKLFNPSEDKLFVDAAWISALKSELARTDEVIQRRLGGKTITEILKENEDFEMEYNKLNKELQDLQSKSLSSEEYYKKRRELDILKIEKENFEYSISNEVKNVDTTELSSVQAEISKLTKQIEEAEATRNSLPVILSNFKSLTEGVVKEILSLKEKMQIIIIS